MHLIHAYAHIWPKLLALGLVVLFVGALAWLGGRIPPNDSGPDG